MASTIDPDGRIVRLPPGRWAHIAEAHPELRTLQHEVLRAISDPSETMHEARPGEDWYYLRGAGPSGWLKVVVAFEENKIGIVLTAFPRRSKP